MIADTHKLSALKKFVEFHEDGRRAEFWSPQGPAQVPFKVQLTLVSPILGLYSAIWHEFLARICLLRDYC